MVLVLIIVFLKTSVDLCALAGEDSRCFCSLICSGGGVFSESGSPPFHGGI